MNEAIVETSAIVIDLLKLGTAIILSLQLRVQVAECKWEYKQKQSLIVICFYPNLGLTALTKIRSTSKENIMRRCKAVYWYLTTIGQFSPRMGPSLGLLTVDV